jgi:hypothetical protein
VSEPARIPSDARNGERADAARLRAASTGSIAAALEPFDWDQDDAIAYEVAVDTIGLVVAAHSGLLASEGRRPAPDPARQQKTRDAIARATADRKALVGADQAQVHQVTAMYAAELRRLQQLADA